MARGRPRTKPVRTTLKRPYTKRGTAKGHYSKANIALRKQQAKDARLFAGGGPFTSTGVIRFFAACFFGGATCIFFAALA